jgi:hypothetical protein
MEVDDNVSMIVGDPQGILDQQLWPLQIPLLNIILILINHIWFAYYKTEDHPVPRQKWQGVMYCPRKHVPGIANVAIAGIYATVFAAKFTHVNKP